MKRLERRQTDAARRQLQQQVRKEADRPPAPALAATIPKPRQPEFWPSTSRNRNKAQAV